MRAPRALILLASLLLALPGFADRLELTDGSVLEGDLVEDTGRVRLFLVQGAPRPRRFRHEEVAQLSVRFPTEEERVLRDPRWSEERVVKRIERDFDPDLRSSVKVYRSQHFILFSLAPGGDAQSTKFLQRDMEAIYAAFLATFPCEEQPGAHLLPVFLLKDHEQYARWSTGPTDWTLEVARQSAGHASRDYFATYFTGSATAVMWHETAHQLVANVLGIRGGGSWFQEGMAVYFEAKHVPGEQVANLASGMISSGRVTPFRELFEVTSLLHSAGDSTRESVAGSRYTQSGQIIWFLAEGPWKDRFPVFLELVRSPPRPEPGQTTSYRSLWDAIFMEVYQRDVDGVEEAWKAYYLSSRR